MLKPYALIVDLNSYLEHCMRSLLKDETPPTCYIRLDRSHFVKSIVRHKELHNIDIQCDSLQQMEVIAKQLFTITICEYVDDDVANALASLKHLVETHMFELDINSDAQENTENLNDGEISSER